MKYFCLGFLAVSLFAFSVNSFALTDEEIQMNEDRLWLLVFILGLIVSFGLGAMKGGQR